MGADRRLDRRTAGRRLTAPFTRHPASPSFRHPGLDPGSSFFFSPSSRTRFGMSVEQRRERGCIAKLKATGPLILKQACPEPVEGFRMTKEAALPLEALLPMPSEKTCPEPVEGCGCGRSVARSGARPVLSVSKEPACSC
jgi:hypothetical protein